MELRSKKETPPEKDIFDFLEVSKLQKNLSKEESEKYYDSLKSKSVIVEKGVF